MAASRRSPEKLQQLAWDAHIVQLEPVAKLRLRDNEVPNFVTVTDEQNADQLITSEQSSSFLRKPTIRTKSRLSSYTYKNLTVALSKAFDGECTPGLVQALLNKDQDVAAIKNDETRRAQLQQRDDFLTKAVEIGDSDLVWVVAPKTSSAAKTKGLNLALKRRDAKIIRILLECGSDPRAASKEFLEAVEKGDMFILELLLSAPQPLPNELLLSAIPSAVSGSSLQILQRIVQFTNFEGWLEPEAVNTAIRSSRLDMLLVLLFAARQVKPEFLAKEVLELVQQPLASSEITTNLLQALLYAGAMGNDCSAAFRIAAENQDISLVRLLVSSDIDVNWGQGVILKEVARTGHIDLLRAVLAGSNVSVDNVSSAVKNLPNNMQEADRLEMLRILIDFGARGRPLEDEIVSAIQRNDIDIVQLLRAKGVSVDTRAGDALIAAIQTENLTLLCKLLEGPVSQVSLQNAFPHTQTVQRSLRMKFMQPLLQAQVEGDAVHAALRDIVAEHSCTSIDESIDPLLIAQADPTFDDCKSLISAVRVNNTDLLVKLLKCPVGVSESVAGSLVSEVLKIQKPSVRPVLMRAVLQAGPRRENVSAAALALLGEASCEVELLELLISSGMVDVNFGPILTNAAIHTDLRALSEVAKLADFHRDTMKSAIMKLIASPRFTEDEKLERLRLLFSSARTSVRSHGANIGLCANVKFWQSSGLAGKFWPMAMFEYLLSTGADPSSEESLVAETVSAGATRLVEAFVADERVRPHVDDALPRVFNAERGEQIGLLKILLKALPSKHALSEMLIAAANKSFCEMCDVLLDFGAMPEFENCAALRCAVSKYNTDLVAKFLARKPSAEVLNTAFEEAKLLQDLPHKLLVMRLLLHAGIPKGSVSSYMIEVLSAREVSEELIQLLLEEKADPSSDMYRSIVLATARNNMKVIDMLFERIENLSEAASKAFDMYVANNNITLQFLPMLMFLLQHGARGPMLSTALIKTVHAHTKTSDLLQLVKALIESGADIDESQGEALCIACGSGDVDLVSAIFQVAACPNVASRSRALQYLIDSPAEADGFCSVLTLLMGGSTVTQDSKNSISGPKLTFTSGSISPVRRFLAKRPRDQLAFQKLLNCGCEALQKIVDDSILIWAMYQAPARVSASCLSLLIEAC